MNCHSPRRVCSTGSHASPFGIESVRRDPAQLPGLTPYPVLAVDVEQVRDRGRSNLIRDLDASAPEPLAKGRTDGGNAPGADAGTSSRRPSWAASCQTLQGLDVKLVVDPLGKLRPDAGNGAKELFRLQ